MDGSWSAIIGARAGEEQSVKSSRLAEHALGGLKRYLNASRRGRGGPDISGLLYV